ncbi:MAG TPA: HPr(Ser) kinase/phosphatase [Firmicutes bacterium]|nr:HPr(Ser) kinase/phosphatase [Bacillota bacterium]
MVATFTVPLSKVMKELGLTTVYLPMSADEILLSSRDVNRPGLELSGFYDYFDKNRILIFGNAETAFLASFSREKRRKVLEGLFSRKPPAVIVARNITPAPEMVEAAQKCQVALLKTADTTSSLVASLVAYMNTELAPRITRHGVLVEVYGEGILLVGDSGVGKSETAIELIKRGHRLIADDAVEIRRVSAKTLVGSAPENIRHFIELRGIGIINARRIFGMGAVKISERIDMCINLEIWDNTKMYDRMGLDNEYTEILGNKVPVMTIPVKPGRNLAIIIEVAAMNNRQKKMGYNAAQELMASLGMDVSAIAETETKKELDI